MTHMSYGCWAGAMMTATALIVLPAAVRADDTRQTQTEQKQTAGTQAEQRADEIECSGRPDALFTGLFRRLAAIESSGDESEAARRIAMFKAFNNTFSTEPLARAAIGRYWDTASEETRRKYLKLFHFHFMENYLGMAVQASTSLDHVATHFSDNGEAVIVLKALAKNKAKDNDDAFNDLRVHVAEAPCGLALVDVEAGAWSLGELMRAEFRSIARDHGIDALIARLETQARGSGVWTLWQAAR